MIHSFWSRVRYACRTLASRPAFTAVALVSLALGIGANTAIFSLVNAILLREIPLENPEELVEVYYSTPDFEYGVLSYPDYDDFVESTRHVFSRVSAMKLALARVERGERIDVLPAEVVTGNYFEMLGIEAALGRTISPLDDVAPDAHPVVVLGYGYWQSAWGGDPEVVGQTLRMGSRPYTVIGVAPEAYPGHLRGLVPSLFVPRMMVNDIQGGQGDELRNRGNHSLFVQARRLPSVTLIEARAATDSAAARIAESAPEDWDPQGSFVIVPSEDVVLFPPVDRYIHAAAWLLMVVVGLVLLIACINLASFLLARALDRRKEIALRLALGAGRLDLVGQLLTETTMLSLLGGVLGVAIGAVLLKLLLSADLPLPLPITIDPRLDATVLGFTLLVSVAAGLLLGLVPAVQATRPDVAAVIKDETAGMGRSGKFGMRNVLVVAQVATSLVLLVGAGLFLRSLQRIQTADPGFGRDPAAVVSIGLSSRYETDEEGLLFFERLEREFRSLPGVSAVGATSNLHLNQLSIQNINVNVDGVEPPPGRDAHILDRATVTHGFFEAAGVRILLGRNFDERDHVDARRVAIINEAMAEKFWPGRDPIGSVIHRPDGEKDIEVIGIASNAKVRSIGEAPRAFVYLPLSQSHTSFLTLIAKTDIDPNRTAADMMASARKLDESLLLWEAKTLERHLAIVKLPARLSALVLGSFAVLALALACMGLYGVVSYAVAQRLREVGIRISLGAESRTVVGMLMGSGMRLVALGGVLGLGASFAIAPALESLLFAVEPVDLVAFTVMPSVLLMVALLSAYLPARRASRIDPVRALRAE
ncbi:MAG TPA: ABC transporter permease [Vicinamibacteria bacterium]|nr:ABC transporter permease [Vicinamibacteria bacterium]